MAIARISTLASTEDDWLERVAVMAASEPLVETATTLASLEKASCVRKPGVVFVGIGLCTSSELSRSLPIDVLGMLLPAERLRRAAGADKVVALVADEHARVNGFDEGEVERRAQRTVEALQKTCAVCDFERFEIVRASEFHRTLDYQKILAGFRSRMPGHYHDYVKRQVADLHYLQKLHGPVLKIGWAVPGGAATEVRDERGFDRLYMKYGGDNAAFVYCKPGRAMNDDAPRAVPYVTVEPETRVCLDPEHEPAEVLSRPVSSSTAGAVYRHLRGILYTFGREVGHIRGSSLAIRLDALFDEFERRS